MLQRSHQRMPLPADTTPDNFKRTPQAFPRTQRQDFVRSLTTAKAGQFIPAFAVPLLREDRLLETVYSFNIEMAQTERMLMNAVRVRASVWAVPKMAFERFSDMGQITRSYLGQNEADGSPIPWFQHHAYWSAPDQPEEFYKVLGAHCRPASSCTTDYVEAYNCIWNYMATQASPSLTHRVPLDTSIAPAFWQHTSARHIKPTFDQALIHGEVPLNVTDGQLPVRSRQYQTVDNTTGPIYPGGGNFASPGQADAAPAIDPVTGDYVFDTVWAELEQNGITVSLSNIELATKTAGFARARQAYQGLGDQEIIDLLMSGVSVPDEALNYPMMLGQATTVVGMSQRYATDYANLEQSVTEGQTVVEVAARTPRITTGAIIMGIVEIVPEQIYERREDPYLMAADVSYLPDRLRDELDLEPVEIVQNAMMDVDHTTGGDTFGYAPLNHRWQRDLVHLGGRFFRGDADAPWSEDRARIWASENVDPVLGDDFYLAKNLHHQVFKDAINDQFEVGATGISRIEGLTMFGPALRESYGDYEAVAAKADLSRLDPPPSPASLTEDND